MKKNTIKKFLILTLTFLLVFTGVAYASHFIKKQPVFYGNVYLYVDNAPLYYKAINSIKSDKLLFLVCNPVGLVNKGHIMDIQITCPIERSYVIIVYKDKLYRFYLKPYKVYENFILWNFSGGG